MRTELNVIIAVVAFAIGFGYLGDMMFEANHKQTVTMVQPATQIQRTPPAEKIQHALSVSADTNDGQNMQVEMEVYGDVNTDCWNRIESMIEDSITGSDTAVQVPNTIENELDAMDNDISGCNFDLMGISVFSIQ